MQLWDKFLKKCLTKHDIVCILNECFRESAMDD